MWIIDPLRLPQDIFTDSGSNVVEEAKSSKEAATEDPEAGSQGEWGASRAEQSRAEQSREQRAKSRARRRAPWISVKRAAPTVAPEDLY